MMNKITDRLPTRTWNWLGVNEAELPVSDTDAVKTNKSDITLREFEKADTSFIKFSNSSDTPLSEEVTITAEKNSELTLFTQSTAESPLKVSFNINADDGAKIKLVHFINPSEGTFISYKSSVLCGKDSSIKMIVVLLGKGDIYYDNLTELRGDGSSLVADIGYLGQMSQTIDINMVVNQYGKDTSSVITANGALTDKAKKIFRGSIDFKTGSSGSVGTENETVLMLSDDAVNKTVPLILCSEENVEGNHGATIGDLDDDTIFYFGSRGIDKEEAQSIMARAAIQRLASLSENEEFEKAVTSSLDETLSNKNILAHNDGGIS